MQVQGRSECGFALALIPTFIASEEEPPCRASGELPNRTVLCKTKVVGRQAIVAPDVVVV